MDELYSGNMQSTGNILGAGAERSQVRRDTILDNIEGVNQRLAVIDQQLEGFLSRFHGAGPDQPRAGATAPIAAGHHGALMRLSELVDSVANRVQILGQIG